MRAVCSAVGMGGANAMAVLEEPEHLERKTREAGHAQNSDGNGLSQLLLYSGKTKQAAETLRDSIEDYVKSSDVDLAGAAYMPDRTRTVRPPDLLGHGSGRQADQDSESQGAGSG